MVGPGLPHGSQDDAVEQAAVQPFGHLQPCPLHSDRGDKAQHDTQAAEHSEYHGIDRLVQGAFLGGRRKSLSQGRAWAQPSFLVCVPCCGLQSYLAEGAVPGSGAEDQGTVSPLGQPIINGHQDHVLEQLREDKQGQEQNASRGQILSAGSPWDLGSLMQHRREVVIFLALGCLLCRLQEPTL